MSIDDAGNLNGLITARRLLMLSERYSTRFDKADDEKKSNAATRAKSARDDFEEDQAILSGESPADVVKSRTSQDGDDLSIRLTDLIAQFKAIQQQSLTVTDEESGSTIEVTTQSSLEVNIEYHASKTIDGLVRQDQNVAETDRYRFDFLDGGTFKITDKWSNKSTTIWGDPHVDTSDQEGDRNGDFSDLSGSDTQTTLMLEDGTRITFTARDNGVIEQIDIFKDDQHLTGIGGASRFWSPLTGLFSTPVDNDGKTVGRSLDKGDVLYAGGDGNDWFDAGGRLVWGATTGEKPTHKPSSSLSISVQRTYQQTVRVVPVDVQA